MAITKGKYYANEQILQISNPEDINMNDLVVKYSLNNKWKNPYVQLRIKYNNGGSVVQCTPSFMIGTSMRMSKMPQPGDVMGKKNAFLMAVPERWITVFENLTDIIKQEMTKTGPIQRWDVGSKAMKTEPNALMYMFGGVNPDQLFRHFPQAKPWVKDFGTQIKKPKMDKWTEDDWGRFSDYFRGMLSEAEEGSTPAMKPLLIKPKEGSHRSMRITCKNMELGKSLIDDEGRPKAQTAFQDKDKGKMTPESAIRDLTYDESGSDGLSTRGGDMPVVVSVSLWWYWVNDKGVNPTMNINRIVYQKPKVLDMASDTTDMEEFEDLFQKPAAPVFGGDDDNDAAKNKRRSDGQDQYGHKKSRRISDDEAAGESESDSGFGAALDSD